LRVHENRGGPEAFRCSEHGVASASYLDRQFALSTGLVTAAAFGFLRLEFGLLSAFPGLRRYRPCHLRAGP